MKIWTLTLLLTCAVALNACGKKSLSSGGGAATVSGPAYAQGPKAAEQPIDESQVARGQKLFQEKGCSACHAFGQRLSCPDLEGVSMRRTAAWMERQILHPDVMVKEDPDARQLFAQFALQMPNQGLTPEEAKAVIEFFKHQDHESAEEAHEAAEKK